MVDDMSEEDAKQILREFQESRQSLHSFLTNVIKADDTTKMGNLTQDELGNPKVPFRTFKQLEAFSEDIYGDKSWAEWFRRLGEIHTASSLSKDAILLKAAITQKKELSDMTPQRKVKKNSGMFGFKKKGEED